MSADREFETVTVQAGEGHCLEDSRARTPVVTLALTAGLLARGCRCIGRVQRWMGCYTALSIKASKGRLPEEWVQACQADRQLQDEGICFCYPFPRFCHTLYTFLPYPLYIFAIFRQLLVFRTLLGLLVKVKNVGPKTRRDLKWQKCVGGMAECVGNMAKT